MKVEVEVLVGLEGRQPKASDIRGNIAALARAMEGKSVVGDYPLLRDTLCIMESIHSKLVDVSRRGTGTTTRQMLEAPVGSLFIWCSDNKRYPFELSLWLGRADLNIAPPSYLESSSWRGKRWPAVVVDHAAQLTPYQMQNLTLLKASCIR